MTDYGFLSIIPPLLSIILAVITKEVFVSLSIGCFLGAIIIAGWDPFTALYVLIIEYFFPQMADSYNAQAFFMMVLVGGSAFLLTASGGALAFKNHKVLRVFTKSRPMAEVGTWLGGLFIWFSDTANSLIVGPVFENINNNVNVSKEKFSYILDCTASPICALVPIMGWGVYIMSLVEKEIVNNSALTTTAWDLFLSAIPYSTYAILTLIMCGFMSWSQWDFGPMLRAQMRADRLGKLSADGAVPMRKTKDVTLPEGVKPRLITLMLPLAIILVCIFSILTIHGFPYKPIAGSKIRAAIAYGFICGDILLCIMLPKFKIMSFKDCIKTLTDGMSNMMYMCLVLLLAWTLGSLCKNLGTAPYLISVTKGLLHPKVLPALIFVSGAIVSFATGTSWGTYALFMPLAIPLAAEMGVSLPVCIAAVVSGGLFGDHCSPISDSTLLAAMGAGADLIDHFETQMPYALLIGSVCTILYLFSDILSPIILLLIGFLIVVFSSYILHKVYLKKYSSEF
ncbi:MAG: Na+/H+ antiporter NhaC family protein [Synergistaceae bacterium]|jgi:Na+/H+ antiporter NhaC|nr:sodium:proton antiporter [Candidatus Cloacimonadota bacterium]MDD2284241.1 Na+/H+ antiporter NhaC family protein [Paludibacter sp.]MDD4428598.1 Na+/H+ antiporter NhaC family protein [Paludibacter sp.]